MDSFKINYYLQPETIKTKKCLILISVLWEDNRLRTTLNLSVPQKNWDKTKQLLKDQATDSVRINSKLIEIRYKLNEYFTKYKLERKKEPPKIEVKEIIKSVLEDREPRKIREKKEKQKTFFEYFKEFVKDSEKGIRLAGSGKPIQPSTIKSYITTQNHLEEFLKTLKTETDFTNINDTFFVALTKYFGKKKLSNNSQGRAIKILKTFLHYTYQNHLVVVLLFHIVYFYI